MWSKGFKYLATGVDGCKWSLLYYILYLFERKPPVYVFNIDSSNNTCSCDDARHFSEHFSQVAKALMVFQPMQPFAICIEIKSMIYRKCVD